MSVRVTIYLFRYYPTNVQELYSFLSGLCFCSGLPEEGCNSLWVAVAAQEYMSLLARRMNFWWCCDSEMSFPTAMA
jgi:hypothetical protein